MNLENMKTGALKMLQNGLVQYMRKCIEELIEVGRSSRNLNVMMRKDIAPGYITRLKCLDERSLTKQMAPVELDMICVSTPR